MKTDCASLSDKLVSDFPCCSHLALLNPFAVANLNSEHAPTPAAPRQISELTDTCEALTLDKEQLALENEDLQVSFCPTKYAHS